MIVVGFGENREAVESQLGPPMHPGKESRAVYDIGRLLVISYTGDDLVNSSSFRMMWAGAMRHFSTACS
jgi:hypothetical protein